MKNCKASQCFLLLLHEGLVFKICQILIFPSLNEVIEEGINIFGGQLFLSPVNIFLSSGERYDCVVSHFEGLMVVDVGEVRHAVEEVFRGVKLSLKFSKDKHLPNVMELRN